MAAELVDRFGKLPEEVENLLGVVALKRACREAAWKNWMPDRKAWC